MIDKTYGETPTFTNLGEHGVVRRFHPPSPADYPARIRSSRTKPVKTVPKVRKKVLVIDDNSAILYFMERALRLKDYGVHTSETFTGVETVEKYAPDLIYLDIGLAGQDGRQIAQVLKNNQRTKNVPIVMITAYPHAEKLAEEAGADSHLAKPFDLARLWEVTEKYTMAPAKLPV